MKLSRVFAAVIMIAVLLGSLNITVLADETTSQDLDTTVTHGSHSLDAASAYLGSVKLADNVAAAVLYEVNSDTLMYAWHADERMYPSSLVKILTALLAVEKGDLQASVTVTQEALDTVPYYAASAELQAGEVLTLSDLLYCMMVGSANDAAAVIAMHVSGSIDSFVKEMNAYAQGLGCSESQFTNVHGLHDENQYTTARDMARILAAATKNEQFIKYFSAVNYLVPATNKSAERELSSGNFLMNTDNMQLYYDQRVTGGRTGIAEDGSRCLAASAQSNGMNVVSVVMGAESTFAEDGNTLTYGSFKETSTLLDACFNGYQVCQILYEGQVLKQSSVSNGENDVLLCSEESVYSVLPANVTTGDLTFKYEDIQESFAAPIERGQVLSAVQVWHGGFCVAQAKLTALNSVKQAPTLQSNTQPQGSGALQIAFTIVVFVVVTAICILLLIKGVPYFRSILHSRRGKQYRRSRRRSR